MKVLNNYNIIIKKYDKYGVSAIFIVYIKSAGDGT